MSSFTSSSRRKSKVRVGVLGCGAIGSRIARSIGPECGHGAVVSAVFDINPAKSQQLQKFLRQKDIIRSSYSDFLLHCDFMVEAVNAPDTHHLVKEAVMAKKDVLIMSVGKFIDDSSVLALAAKYGVKLLIPSGAVAGIDAIKSASLGKIHKLVLTTRKPIYGFADNAYLQARRINLSQIRKETILFEGSVGQAVKCFPQNINVAATIALASGCMDKLKIRIITSGDLKVNAHEIEVVGEFGRLVTKTENVVCPDNPKTSYLAVLSAIQTLKEHVMGVRIGT